MPLSKQEQRCITLVCRYLGKHYGGSWTIRENLDDRKLQEPTPEVIVSNGNNIAAIEVKRLIDSVTQNYIANLLSNERFFAPSCGGSYYFCPPLGFEFPMAHGVRRIVKREIERVAPTLSSGQKGTINIPRQGRVSLIAESGPPAIYCCHGNRYSELMSHIMEKITGRFMLVDDKLEHSFITQKCKDAFAEAVVAACMKCLQGNNSDFKWYEEWELVRTDMGDGVSHDGVWVLAASSAHSLQASTEQCVHAVLDNAMRKFKRTPPWAEIQVIVLEI
jgi:hypothetical protein